MQQTLSPVNALFLRHTILVVLVCGAFCSQPVDQPCTQSFSKLSGFKLFCLLGSYQGSMCVCERGVLASYDWLEQCFALHHNRIAAGLCQPAVELRYPHRVVE